MGKFLLAKMTYSGEEGAVSIADRPVCVHGCGSRFSDLPLGAGGGLHCLNVALPEDLCTGSL